MSITATKPWNPAGHFVSEADAAAYLEAAVEEGDPTLIAAALGDISSAEGPVSRPVFVRKMYIFIGQIP